MLKDQFREQNNVLKNTSEERDSYKTALQIMTKEINAHKEKTLSFFHHNLSLLTLTIDNAVGQFNKIFGTTEARGALTSLQSQKIHFT